MKIKELLLEKLESFTNIKTEFKKEDDLHIFSTKNENYIEIHFWEREHTVFFGNWHWHFSNDDFDNKEMIDTIMRIVRGQSRIKDIYINNKLVRSDLEFNDANEYNTAPMKTGIINFGFLRRKRVKEVKYRDIEF